MKLKNYQSFLWVLFALFATISLVRLGMSLATSGVGVNNVAAGSSDSAVDESARLKIKVGFSNAVGNYDPAVIRLKKGVPVELDLDPNTLTGCMSVVLVPDLNLQGLAGKNPIRFTPQKIGSFAFHCPMGMGRGTIIVE